MRFRLQKFTSIYPTFERQFLNDIPDSEQLSYQELYDCFVNTWYAQANYFTRHLQALEHEAEDYFASLEPLQKAWAREHDAKYGADTWLQDIVVSQIKHFRPDVVYFQDLYLFDGTFRRRLRDLCNWPVIIIGWRAAPTRDFSIFRDLDLVLSAGPNFVQAFRDNGVNAVYMPLAFEHKVLDVIKLPAERDLKFTFVGNPGNNNGAHSQRYALLEQLMAHTPLQVWGEISPSPLLAKRVAYQAIYQVNRVLKMAGISDAQRRSLPLIGRGAYWNCRPISPPFWQRYPDRCHAQYLGCGTLKSWPNPRSSSTVILMSPRTMQAISDFTKLLAWVHAC